MTQPNIVILDEDGISADESAISILMAIQNYQLAVKGYSSWIIQTPEGEQHVPFGTLVTKVNTNDGVRLKIVEPTASTKFTVVAKRLEPDSKNHFIRCDDSEATHWSIESRGTSGSRVVADFAEQRDADTLCHLLNHFSI